MEHEVSWLVFTPVSLPILINSFHTFSTYFIKVHSNIIFPSTLRFSNWSLSLRFSSQNFVCISHIPMWDTCTTHFYVFELITLTIFGEAYKLWSSSLCPLLHSHYHYVPLGPNTAPSNLLSGALNPYSSFRLRGKVSDHRNKR